MREDIQEVKNKVYEWLKEEGLSPEELSDPNSYFNFGITIGDNSFNIVQKIDSNDSIFIGTNLVLSNEQTSSLTNISDDKKQEMVWGLRMSLIRNKDLLEFNVRPDPPQDIQEVYLSSRRIFYDGLIKNALINLIHSLYKTIKEVIWIFEYYTENTKPKEDL